MILKRKKYKFYYALVIAVCLIFILVINSKDSQSQKGSMTLVVDTDVPDKDVFVDEVNDQEQLHLETYKDLELEKEQKKVTQSKKKEEKASDRKEASSTKENKTRIVVDESKETIRDETEGTEDEYIAQNEPNGKVDLDEPTEIEGEDVEGDVSPSGKHIGTWG